jgi:hypothetical protein
MSIETKQTRNQVELLNALHVAREYESIPIREPDGWTVPLLRTLVLIHRITKSWSKINTV